MKKSSNDSRSSETVLGRDPLVRSAVLLKTVVLLSAIHMHGKGGGGKEKGEQERRKIAKKSEEGKSESSGGGRGIATLTSEGL
jgi:hypothetical protein